MQRLAAFLILLTTAGSISSCSSTQRMSLSVQEPAPVSLPPNIKKIVIVNRSVAKSAAIDITDKIFSLEGVELDKAGAAATISGLTTGLQRDSRFDEVKVMRDELTTVNPAVFPSPLTWDVVEKLCRENHADALFSLELFDTDSKISYGATPVKLNTIVGAIPAIEHQATMLTRIKTGWRIYDPASKYVLDEYTVDRHISYTGKGINPLVAAAALTGRKEAVKEVGNKSGEAYALRIVPYWIRVSRDYYTRGTNNFSIAKRRAQTGNWDQAADLWEQETKNPNGKIAGRACYNMAIINEINGDLNVAIDWAGKAYEDYNNRLALRYVNMLKDRKFRNGILKEQQEDMANGK